MTAAGRLAAIMAVDVVGYSRLVGEDEAGTVRALRERRDAARPVVASLGGRIVKTTGDRLLLEFPSVVAAVECAIAILERQRRVLSLPQAGPRGRNELRRRVTTEDKTGRRKE